MAVPTVAFMTLCALRSMAAQPPLMFSVKDASNFKKVLGVGWEGANVGMAAASTGMAVGGGTGCIVGRVDGMRG